MSDGSEFYTEGAATLKQRLCGLDEPSYVMSCRIVMGQRVKVTDGLVLTGVFDSNTPVIISYHIISYRRP